MHVQCGTKHQPHLIGLRIDPCIQPCLANQIHNPDLCFFAIHTQLFCDSTQQWSSNGAAMVPCLPLLNPFPRTSPQDAGSPLPWSVLPCF